MPPEECSTNAECDDDNPCTDQKCGTDGECEYTNNEATCDDGDGCTTDDVCAAGVCSGAPTCGDDCDACAEPAITPVAVGFGQTCARKSDGIIRCWGNNELGEAGYPPNETVGGDIDVGGPVLQMALGHPHSCALLEGGAVRCWGGAGRGRLGYGNGETIGDEPGETPASGGDVDLGGEAVSLDVSADHSCARWSTGPFAAGVRAAEPSDTVTTILRDTAEHDAAIELILALKASTTSRFAPDLPAGLKNTWQEVAERGLFAFDADANGGPYRLVAAPASPLRGADLPTRANAVVSRLALCHLRFTSLSQGSEAHLRGTE